jgi:hypothetical protein
MLSQRYSLVFSLGHQFTVREGEAPHSLPPSFQRELQYRLNASRFRTPTPTKRLGELVEMTSAESVCVAADKALSEWRERHAR